MLNEPMWFHTHSELLGGHETWMFVVKARIPGTVSLRRRILSDPRGIRWESAGNEVLPP